MDFQSVTREKDDDGARSISLKKKLYLYSTRHYDVTFPMKREREREKCSYNSFALIECVQYIHT
jgi:hypothetical protein